MIFKSPYPDVEIPEVPLTEHLIEQMKAYGDKTALVDGPSGRAYTFNQLIGAIRRVAVPAEAFAPRGETSIRLPTSMKRSASRVAIQA
jgi:hypothetical protein